LRKNTFGVFQFRNGCASDCSQGFIARPMPNADNAPPLLVSNFM
jgi:hypothetical protein